MRITELKLRQIIRDELQSEIRIRMSHDPDDMGAYIDDDTGVEDLPVMSLPLGRITGFEPDEKMTVPKHRRRMLRMVGALRDGGPDALPPILVRRHPRDPEAWQVVDGHHRLAAHRIVGSERVPARVIPDASIEDELLREVRITPDNLPDDFALKLRVSNSGGHIVVLALRDGVNYGSIEAVRVKNEMSPCSGAYEVLFSRVTRRGFGPLLYDIAMEAATELGGGLMSDRMVVSNDAQRVWGKYQNDRPDVERMQLDSEENELTPTRADNCSVLNAKSFAGDNWPDHPLSGAYRKPGMETIRQLVRMKKIQIDGMDI